MGVRERPVEWRELEQLLMRLGFALERQPGTAHAQWEHPCFRGERRLVTVSRHHSPFARGLLRLMRCQMGLTKAELFRALRDDAFAARLAGDGNVENQQ
ncbi:MAG: type II toxin-antitoxin system HicA family toxin [Lamprobacter sp.]|uniref:type II toxin-antitoxin system HicA family toxin n=1 Tax=Lamprobacter sp. TaxID=3100796 RepID=UPI002B25B3F2|nr:type II toxin-antitoxin system HicA family toxin [Lamprobacter sp.]MEA3642834.1 type II toxin-antitoxin system HicA family toxin [Lamprobacter sp.]